MASPEEAQGLQQPPRMRKLGHGSLHRPTGKIVCFNCVSFLNLQDIY